MRDPIPAELQTALAVYQGQREIPGRHAFETHHLKPPGLSTRSALLLGGRIWCSCLLQQGRIAFIPCMAEYLTVSFAGILPAIAGTVSQCGLFTQAMKSCNDENVSLRLRSVP